MFFTQPWMLWGMLGIVIPVIVHFLRGRQTISVEWAAYQFLEHAQANYRTRMRIEDYVLLVIRMLTIAFLVMTLAVPTYEDSPLRPQTNQGEQPSHCFAIDQSYSMGSLDTNRTPMSDAKSYLKDQISHQEKNISTSIFLLAQSDAQLHVRRAHEEKNELLEFIDEIQPGQGKWNPEDSLQSLQEQIEAESRSKSRKVQLTLITDSQAINWNQFGKPSGAKKSPRKLLEELAQMTQLRILILGNDQPSKNVRLIKFDVSPQCLISGETVTLDIAIRNDGPESVTRSFDITIGGIQRVERKIRIDAKTTKELKIPLQVSGQGIVEIVAQLDLDLLPTDNLRLQAVRIVEELQVLLVSDHANTSSSASRTTAFVQAALESIRLPENGRPVFKMTNISSDQLVLTDLQQFDCIVLCNLSQLSDRAAGPLHAFVQRGGGLVCGVGDRVQSENWNMFSELANDLFPQFSGIPQISTTNNSEPISFTLPEIDHPITAPFGMDEKRSLATSPINQFVEFQDLKSFKTILKFSNGKPAILEKNIGTGCVIFYATSLDDSWGFWTYWPSFVPLVAESVRFSSIQDTGIRSATVSEPLEVSQFNSTEVSSPIKVERQFPIDSETERVELPQVDSNVFLAPDRTGVYRYSKANSDRPAVLVVNVDPTEGDLKPLKQEQLEQVLNGIPAKIQFFSDQTIRQTRNEKSEKRPELTILALFLFLSLLLSEQVMRKRFYRGLILLSGLIALNFFLIMVPNF